MYYAYALVHKDKDGYERPLEAESDGKVILYTTKFAAEYAMGAYFLITNNYITKGRTETIYIPRKWWFDKRKSKTIYPTSDRVRELKLIMNTLYVKRVKLA